MLASDPIAAASPAIGLVRRAVGVMRAPRATFEQLRAHPTWLAMAVTVLVVIAASFLVVSAAEVGRQAALDQAVTRLEAFGVTVDDTRYAALERLAPSFGLMAAALTITAGPITLFAVSGVIYAVVRGRVAGEPTFRQVLSMVAHTGVILALQRLVAVPALFLTESLSTPANLSVLVPMLEESSFPARFLGSIDVFTVWWTIVLAIGIGTIYRRPSRRLVVTCCTLYAAVAGVLAAIVVLRGGS